MTEFAITTQKLCKNFGANRALIDVDVKVKTGITTGLVGPNGAGKTTLFSLLCGFLKPSSGSISVLGHGPDSPEIRGQLAILPQDA